jgi:hypothetical protein
MYPTWCNSLHIFNKSTADEWSNLGGGFSAGIESNSAAPPCITKLSILRSPVRDRLTFAARHLCQILSHLCRAAHARSAIDRLSSGTASCNDLLSISLGDLAIAIFTTAAGSYNSSIRYGPSLGCLWLLHHTLGLYSVPCFANLYDVQPVQGMYQEPLMMTRSFIPYPATRCLLHMADHTSQLQSAATSPALD